MATKMKLPPGDKGWPLIGESLRMLGDEENFFESRHEKHGDVFLTHLLLKPTVVVRGEKYLRDLFKEENKGMSLKWPKSIDMVTGKNSLLSLSGDMHKRARKLMLPALQKNSVKKLRPRIYDVIKSRVAAWAASPEGVDISQEVADLTYRINVGILMGVDPLSDRTKLMMNYMQIMEHGCIGVPAAIPGTPVGKAVSARKKLLALFQEEIDQKRERLKAREKSGEEVDDTDFDVIETMLITKDKEGLTLSDDEIKDQLVLLFSAGSMTTACSLYCFLSEVCSRPKIYERLFEEFEEECGEGLDRLPSTEELDSCEYLQNVLHEVLRVESPGALIFRHASKDLKCGEYTIPKGYAIILSLLCNHRHEDHFSKADEFNPDRWNDFQQNKANMFKYLPFWQGVRQCIGRHFAQFVRQLVAYELVRKYTVELSGEPKKYGFANIVPLPTGKVIMKLTARANDCAVADRKDDHEADSEEKPNEPAVAKE